MIAPKDIQADPCILTAARDWGVRVVKNNRFRDRPATFSEVRDPGHLIEGGYLNGRLCVDPR